MQKRGGSMKYLKIHKLIWLLLVVGFTSLEILFYLLDCTLYFIWNLRLPRESWSEIHHADKDFENHWGGYAYRDKNILETIKRRYYRTFE